MNEDEENYHRIWREIEDGEKSMTEKYLLERDIGDGERLVAERRR
jgi:hypothetical protein